MALDKSTDINDDAQLAVFSLAVNNQFEVTEELLCVKTMQGRITAKDVFEQPCDAIEHAGLSWKSLRGIIHLFYKITLFRFLLKLYSVFCFVLFVCSLVNNYAIQLYKSGAVQHLH